MTQRTYDQILSADPTAELDLRPPQVVTRAEYEALSREWGLEVLSDDELQRLSYAIEYIDAMWTPMRRLHLARLRGPAAEPVMPAQEPAPARPPFFLTRHVAGVGTGIMPGSSTWLDTIQRYDAAQGTMVSELITALEPLRQALIATVPAEVMALDFGATRDFLVRPNFCRRVSEDAAAALGVLYTQDAGREVTAEMYAWLEAALARNIAVDLADLARQQAEAANPRPEVVIGTDWETGLFVRVIDGPLTLAQAEAAYRDNFQGYRWELVEVETAEHPNPLR